MFLNFTIYDTRLWSSIIEKNIEVYLEFYVISSIELSNDKLKIRLSTQGFLFFWACQIISITHKNIVIF